MPYESGMPSTSPGTMSATSLNESEVENRRTDEPLLEIRNLDLSYADNIVLRRFDLTVDEGEFVCLLGRSGCGKTTLLKLIAGLIRPHGGHMLIDGKAISGPGSDRSMVFQNYGLFPWRTVLGNVEFGLEVRGIDRATRREAALREIRRLGLAGFERHYPGQLSGGMQQRVALARAFTKNPRLLLMDEPFAAVDLQTREFLQDELLKIWEAIRTTVVFVTHSLEEALYLGDRVVVLGPRAAGIQANVRIDLPRPRQSNVTRSSARFGELRYQISEALRGELQ
jgi:NitT/TauT family transport system ATP-binding protein